MAIGSFAYTTPLIKPNTVLAYTYTGYKIPLDVAYQITNTESALMTVALYTYSDTDGTAAIGSVSTETFTVTVPDTIVPKITSLTVELDNGKNSVVAGWNVAVAGFTKVRVTATAEGAYGSTIKSFTISGGYNQTVNGSILDFVGNIINSSGSKSFDTICKDSRGRSSEQYLSSSVRFYSYGFKKYHRRQWERDQEIYIGTKYVSAKVKADQIMFRCNTPQSAVVAPNYDMSIIPFSDMYLSALYGNSPTPIQIRAKAGVEYKITSPWDTDLSSMTDTAILIYAASRIQAMNDLSACYIHDNDFTKASKLQKLIIGNDTDGYSNNFLTSLNIGGNYLLEELNIRNCPKLIGSINLNGCGNLEKFYAEGTAITGVIFAPSGRIVSAYLPDSINAIDMRNLHRLSDLRML